MNQWKVPQKFHGKIQQTQRHSAPIKKNCEKGVLAEIEIYKQYCCCAFLWQNDNKIKFLLFHQKKSVYMNKIRVRGKARCL